MKRLLVVAFIAVAPAQAAPDKRVTWADWVGAYHGKLAWSQCAMPVEKHATLALAASDGVMSIDLAPASAGLRAMSLVEDEQGFSGQQGDIKVAITRGKPNTIAITVELASGCMMKSQLSRPSSGVAACDQLVAWGRVEAACSKTTDRLADLAKLLATKWKPGDASKCSARASKLELALVDAGCAPHPDPAIGTRAKECIALTQATAKLARCGHVPARQMMQLTSEAQALAAAAQTAEKATLPYVEQQCRDARSTITAIATRANCPP